MNHSLKNIFLFLLAVMLYSCASPEKFVTNNEKLLVKNKIKLSGHKSIKKKNDLIYGLSTLYQQKENTRYLAFFNKKKIYSPRLNRYWRLKNDLLKLEKKRNKYEKPAILDLRKVEDTRTKMNNYLKRKGYFNSTVTYKIDTINSTVKVTYFADIKKDFLIGEIKFKSKDPNIDKLLNENKKSSFLKKGKLLEAISFNAEKLRITKLCKDAGYAAFHGNYISPISVDTTQSDDIGVTIEVFKTKSGKNHELYYFGDIDFYFEGNKIDLNKNWRIDKIENIHFHSSSPKYIVNPPDLIKFIKVQPGEKYSQSKIDDTYKALTKLPIFKFIDMAQTIDTINNLVKVKISAFSSKRKQISGDLLTNLSNSNATDVLIGGNLSLKFVDKNFLKKTNIFETSIDIGQDFEINDKSDLLYSNTIHPSFSIQIPRFFNRLSLITPFHKIKLIGNKNYSSWTNNTTTKFVLDYEYKYIKGYQELTTTTVSLNFNHAISKSKNLQYSQIGINYLRPNLLDSVLQNNPLLNKNYGKRFFTGFLVRDLVYTSSSTQNRIQTNLRLGADISGLEMYLYERSAGVRIKVGKNDIPFSHFLKLYSDYSITLKLNQKNDIAVHFGGGIISSFWNWGMNFSESEREQNPFVKQFYLGGANSLRGWSLRELGPGSYHLDDPDPNFYYQTGDLKLEANIEYRFDLFWRLEGALFVDAGNIWNLYADKQRPGANITKDFLDEIAIGSGFGFRADLYFFLIRFDLGAKLRSPYKINNSNWLPSEERKKLNWHVALNYPF